MELEMGSQSLLKQLQEEPGARGWGGGGGGRWGACECQALPPSGARQQS